MWFGKNARMLPGMFHVFKKYTSPQTLFLTSISIFSNNNARGGGSIQTKQNKNKTSLDNIKQNKSTYTFTTQNKSQMNMQIRTKSYWCTSTVRLHIRT